MADGLVLSRSCTTGWFDWGHGELIITADALIRMRLEGPTAEARQWRNTVPANPYVTSASSPDEAPGVLAAHPTNRFILLRDVASAALHSGILSDRLSLRMRDGTRHKLLWLHVDPAHGWLQDRLRGLISGPVRVD